MKKVFLSFMSPKPASGVPILRFNRANELVKKKTGTFEFIESIASNRLSIDTLSDRERGLLALSSARTNPQATIEGIAVFKIKGIKTFEDIALAVAERSAFAISTNIARLGPLRSNIYIDLANKIGQRTPTLLMIFVKNALPLMPTIEARYKFLKAVSQYNGEAVAENINMSGIIDELKKCELAKLAAKQNGGAVSKHIKRFEITNDIRRSEIFIVAYDNAPQGTSKYAIEYSLQTNLLPGFMEKVEFISAQKKIAQPRF